MQYSRGGPGQAKKMQYLARNLSNSEQSLSYTSISPDHCTHPIATGYLGVKLGSDIFRPASSWNPLESRSSGLAPIGWLAGSCGVVLSQRADWLALGSSDVFVASFEYSEILCRQGPGMQTQSRWVLNKNDDVRELQMFFSGGCFCKENRISGLFWETVTMMSFKMFHLFWILDFGKSNKINWKWPHLTSKMISRSYCEVTNGLVLKSFKCSVLWHLFKLDLFQN